MGKNSFVIYKSFYSPISNLTDEQLGRLFRSIFDIQINGEASPDEDILPYFKFFENQFKIDDAKYDEISKRRAESVKKRWNKVIQKNTNDTSNTNVYNCIKSIQMIQNDTNDTSITDNDNDTNISNSNNKSSLHSDLEKKKDKKKTQLAMMEEIDVLPELKEAYREWLQFRTEIDKPFKSQRSIKANYNELLKLSNNNPDTAKAIINQSIAYQWQGLFGLKTSKQTTINQGASNVTDKRRSVEPPSHGDYSGSF